MDRLRRFLADERGAQTIEMVVWIPFNMMLLVLVTDVSMLYLTHTEMWNVARDTTRQMSSGYIRNAADAESYAAQQLSHLSYPFTIDANYEPDSVMAVRIEVTIGDVSNFGFFISGLLGQSMKATVIMRPDPMLNSGSPGV